MSKRFVVECVWSGYQASQSRPCHRMVETRTYRVEALKKVSHVAFTDGTTMSVAVRPCFPREKVQEIRGYRDLLNEIIDKKLTGYVSVASLVEQREQRALGTQPTAT